MAPARTRRRSSGGAGPSSSSVAATMTTPISAAKVAASSATATGGRGGGTGAAATVTRASVSVRGSDAATNAPAVTPAPFAPVGGRSFPEHETTIDDLPEELLLKVR